MELEDIISLLWGKKKNVYILMGMWPHIKKWFVFSVFLASLYDLDTQYISWYIYECFC